ncbi:MAG: MurR/RpiR family transcriptional regulator, partial [Boseongicola sp.]|nr:MurR/RpiR family transcriptional regulator [Boseongicola sp.]
VVRLANKLGFNGYPELRARVRLEVAADPVATERRQQRYDSIEHGSNLALLVESEIAALNSVLSSVPQAQINEATEMLAAARSIYTVGRGSAAPLVAHLDRRLRRLGFATNVALNTQRRDLGEKLMGLGAGDVVLVFAFQVPESLPAGYAGLIQHAAQVGARSIVISDSTGPTLRPRADLTLSVTRPDEGVMQLRTGPMIVCEALAMTLAHLNPERAVAGLEALEVLRQNLMNDKD